MDEHDVEQFLQLIDSKLDDILEHRTNYYRKENGEKFQLEYDEMTSVVAWYENCLKTDLKKIFTEGRGIILDI